MKKRVLMSLLFFVIGILIYLLFNTGTIKSSNFLFSMIRNYLPDALWILSFYFISINIVTNLTKKALLFNSVYVLCIGLLYEMFQLFKIVGGTFDIFDILTYIIMIMFACLIETLLRRSENEKSV